MTSEVVIGNGFGVVLCADTATTRGKRRTYDGARKLIGVPSPHRLGILHSGIVTLHGLPYETLLENWIHSLPPQRLLRLSDYAESFREYLVKSIPEYCDDDQRIKEFLSDWWRRVGRTWEWLQNAGKDSDADIRDYFSGLVGKFDDDDVRSGERWSARVWDVLGRNGRRNPVEIECREKDCSEMWHSSIEGIIDHFFDDVTSSETREVIYQWAKIFLGLYHPCDYSATVAFAGYGERDIVPAVIEMRIEAMMLDRLFGWVNDVESAERTSSGFAFLRTFGQDNEIVRFIREVGLDPHYHQEVVRGSLSKFETGHRPEGKVGEAGSAEEEDVRQSSGTYDFDRAGHEISRELEDVAENNIEHALESLAGMNLRNLSMIAERLVSLQSLSLDLLGQLPTVGGKLVTAVVTLQHGFMTYSASGDPEGIATHVH